MCRFNDPALAARIEAAWVLNAPHHTTQGSRSLDVWHEVLTNRQYTASGMHRRQPGSRNHQEAQDAASWSIECRQNCVTWLTLACSSRDLPNPQSSLPVTSCISSWSPLCWTAAQSCRYKPAVLYIISSPHEGPFTFQHTNQKLRRQICS